MESPALKISFLLKRQILKMPVSTFPRKVFVVSPPSLEVWREATAAGVKILSSVEAVVPMIHSYSGLRPAKKNELGITKVQKKNVEPHKEELPVPVMEKSHLQKNRIK
jgi:hypothetical protein